jgi:AcrR family transcriptional regulator
VNKRDTILERIADFILAQGLDAATLREMAKAADQSDRMLLYYFKDKDEIILEALNLLAERFMATLATHNGPVKLRKDALHSALDEVVLSDDILPFLHLWLALAAGTARAETQYSPAGQAIALGFHQWIEGQLMTTNPDQRRKEATEIMIGLQGVIVLKSVGMQALVRELI